MAVIVQYLINGLTLGSLYALIAIGYTMVYGVLKFINFAHGEVMMVGSYFCLLFYQLFLAHLASTPLLALALALLTALVLTMLLGMVIERVAYRRLRGAPRLAPLLSAVGVSIILANTAAIIWGTRARNFPLPYPNSVLKLGSNLILPLHDLVILAVGLVLMLTMHLFVRYSITGKALRAASLDREMAAVVGVNVNSVVAVTFALGSALATIAGVLIAMRNSLDPAIGNYYGLKAFIASVIGGIGSIPGAMVGGLLLGVLETFGGVLAGSYKELISFITLILLLLIRPSGLMGRKQVDKV